MSSARDPLGLRVGFVGASVVAYGGQGLAGHGHVVFAVAVAALTWLALRSRPHRWVLLLVLLHLAVWLLGTAPASAAHWAGAVVTATGLFALHALTGWLPWASPRTGRGTQGPLRACRDSRACGRAGGRPRGAGQQRHPTE